MDLTDRFVPTILLRSLTLEITGTNEVLCMRKGHTLNLK